MMAKIAATISTYHGVLLSPAAAVFISMSEVLATAAKFGTKSDEAIGAKYSHAPISQAPEGRVPPFIGVEYSLPIVESALLAGYVAPIVPTI